MQLAPCRFRETLPGREGMRCRLVQQLLGLATTDGCCVDTATCYACGRLGTPQPSNPKPVVSSLVYTLARQIRQNGGRSDCDLGQAWQAECYACATLAEEPGGNHERRQPSSATLGFRRRRAGRLFGPFRQRRATIGLVGYGTATGLGYLNRDLAEHGAIDRWLMVDHPHLSAIDLPDVNFRIARVSCDARESVIRRWLQGIDWIVWSEASPLECLPRLAHQAGKRVACVPMWEWTSPTDAWLRYVDLLICPTLHAYRLFSDWKRRFGFEWRVAHFPWPVSTERFRRRSRERCQRFVFVNGRGGAWARGIENNQRLGPRKGLDTVLAAAARAPEIPWTVYTQVELTSRPPSNVEVRIGPTDHEGLYAEGDVCVQPSRWEGLGLPLLECQAAGMPLITVDAAPMNEYRPLRCVAPSHWNWGYVTEGQPMRIPEVSSEALACAVRELHGCDLRAASAEARGWIKRERSWSLAVASWRKLFDELD